MAQTHTVLEALRLPNPDIREREPRNTRNTTSEHFIELSIDDIGEWTDFNYENLYTAYLDILSTQVARRDTYISDNDSQTEINNEEGLDYWMNTCITRELREPLKVTATRMQERQHLPLTNTSFHGRGSGFTITNPAAPRDHRQAFKPDWVAYQRLPPSGVKSALVIGDSKLRYKWKSSDLGLWSTLSTSQRKNLLLPLRQIATYCYHGRTRYGFLVTSTELVATMLYMKHGQVRKLRYRSVPWNADGPGLLTVKLSIFYLVAMALNPLYLRPQVDDEHTDIPNLMLFVKLRSLGDEYYGHPISGAIVKAHRSQVDYGRVSDPLYRRGFWFGYRLRLPIGKYLLPELLYTQLTGVPDPRFVSFRKEQAAFEELYQLSLNTRLNIASQEERGFEFVTMLS